MFSKASCIYRVYTIFEKVTFYKLFDSFRFWAIMLFMKIQKIKEQMKTKVVELKKRGRPIIDLSDREIFPTGTFGKLQPLDYVKEDTEHGSRIYWRCSCACGNPKTVWVRTSHLRAKNKGVKSCGCIRSDVGKVLMFMIHQKRASAL